MKYNFLLSILLVFFVANITIAMSDIDHYEPSEQISTLIAHLERGFDAPTEIAQFIEAMISNNALTATILDTYLEATSAEKVYLPEHEKNSKRTTLVLGLIDLSECSSIINDFLKNTQFFTYEDVQEWQEVKNAAKSSKKQPSPTKTTEDLPSSNSRQSDKRCIII